MAKDAAKLCTTKNEEEITKPDAQRVMKGATEWFSLHTNKPILVWVHKQPYEPIGLNKFLVEFRFDDAALRHAYDNDRTADVRFLCADRQFANEMAEVSVATKQQLTVIAGNEFIRFLCKRQSNRIHHYRSRRI